MLRRQCLIPKVPTFFRTFPFFQTDTIRFMMRRTRVRLRRLWREHKLLILMFSLLGLLGGVFWVGYQLTHRQQEDVWAIIPPDAVLIAEVPDLPKSWTALRQAAFWNPEVPYFKQIREVAARFRGFASDSLPRLPRAIRKNPRFFASLHFTSPEEASWLFYLPLRSELQKDAFWAFIRKDLEANNLELHRRSFNDRTVYEVRAVGSRDFEFGFVWEDNIWVGSYEPLLLDQVVRHTARFEGTPLQPPKRRHTAVVQPDTHLKVHLPLQNWGTLTTALFGEGLPAPPHLAESLQLTFSLSENRLLATGVAGFSENVEAPHYVSLLNKSPLSSSELYRFVPWQTALLLRQNWSEEPGATEKRYDFYEQHAPEITLAQENWSDDYSFESADFRATLGNEVGLAVLEQEARRQAPRLAIVPLCDPEKAKQLLLQFAQNTLPPGRKKPLLRRYERWNIYQLHTAQFPKHFFGWSFVGFEQTYFVFLEDEKMLLLANSPKTLENLYDDLLAERTWGQQIRERRFWEQLEPDASLSLILNAPRLWQWLSDNLQPAWKPVFTAHPQTWLQANFAALQLVPTSKKLSAGLLVEFSGQGGEPPSPSLTTETASAAENIAQRTTFVENIVSKPFLVQNHIDRSWEALVQDETHALHLISRDGKILWNRQLDGRIVPETLTQLDYYDNGKLQYLFATQQQLYILDRLGRILPGFPVRLPKPSRAQSLSLIDYDGSREYRFMVSDQNGRLFLYDKAGRLLAPWKPRSLAMRLAAPVRHIRAGTKDGFIAIQRDGTVNFLKRNGRSYAPFPLRFETPMSNPYLLFPDTRFSRSEVVTLTDLGEQLRFTLTGEILERESLPREGEMRFTLVPDRVRGDTWLAVRREPSGFTVFDRQGELQFFVPTGAAGSAQFQYYRFRTGRSWLVWHDPKSQTATLFRTEDGSPFLKLSSTDEIALLYSEARQQLDIFRSAGKRVEKVRVEEF